MKIKYIKDNSEYFKWFNRNKEKYEIIKVDLIRNSIKVKYRLLPQ